MKVLSIGTRLDRRSASAWKLSTRALNLESWTVHLPEIATTSAFGQVALCRVLSALGLTVDVPSLPASGRTLYCEAAGFGVD
jgi:hypothetical protein